MFEYQCKTCEHGYGYDGYGYIDGYGGEGYCEQCEYYKGYLSTRSMSNRLSLCQHWELSTELKILRKAW